MARKQIVLLDFIDKMEQIEHFQDKLDISSTINQIWEVFLEELRNYIPVDICGLFLVDDKTKEFVFKKSSPGNKQNICKKEIEYQIECDMFSWIINRRKPAVIPSFIFKEKRSVVMLPLSTVKRTMGIVMALTPIANSMITHENLRLLSMLTRQCSLVMENSILYNRVKKEHEALIKAQAEVVQAEKMASIGRLTAGASHEILNPLSIISGHLQLLQIKNNFNADVLKSLGVLQTQTERIGCIIKGLSQFSSLSVSEKEPLNLSDLVNEFISELKTDIKDKLIIIKKLDPESPFIMGNPKSFSQLFSFLLSNALDAVTLKNEDGKGYLEIRTRVDVKTNTNEGDETWMLMEFKDNGCGIRREDMKKVFDPFFTTKKSEYKPGLGLSLAYGIIQDHGGRMEISSVQGLGTSVWIFLPILKKTKYSL